MSMVRCMLADVGVERALRGEAAQIATTIRNCMPISGMEKTLKKPGGVPAQISLTCACLGSRRSSKYRVTRGFDMSIYQIWDPRNRGPDVTCHVIFDENQTGSQSCVVSNEAMAPDSNQIHGAITWTPERLKDLNISIDDSAETTSPFTQARNPTLGTGAPT